MIYPNELYKSCEAVQEELLARFNEGTFDRLTESASKHIAACDTCKNEMRELISLRNSLGNLPIPSLSESYWVRYLPRLRERLEMRRNSLPVKRPVWAPSLTAAALFSLFLVFSPVKIAPPSWFQTDRMVSSTDQILQEDEMSKLERIFSGAEISDSEFDQIELNLIYKLSQSQYDAPKGLYDQLAEVDDQTLEKILIQLHAQPILKFF